MAGALAVTATATAIGSWVGYHEHDLGPAGSLPPALGPGELRAVTLNAWRLSNPDRVPRLVEALEQTGRLLASTSRPSLPEVFAIQELESREAVAALREAVAPTHDLLTCECAFDSSGSVRSTVALGLAREHVEVEAHECIELGRIWPDHPRCAIRADLRTRDGSRVTAVGTHMAWVIDNSTMSDELVASLPVDRPVLVLGDFNTWPGTRSYDRLVAGRLSDACPGAPPTTPISRRVDLVLVSTEWDVQRSLSRRRAFDAMGVKSFLRWRVVRHALDRDVRYADAADCPVTDHLPEGIVVSLREHS